MIFLLLGGASLLVMMGALGMFSRAQVATIKAFGVWIVAIGGLALATLLFLTGRGTTAIGALVLLGPMVWSWMRPNAPSPDAGAGTKNRGPRSGSMTRTEAYAVLGLQDGASETQVREAYHRLMRTAHPDVGGSGWVAAKINEARDCLLS